MRNSLDRFDSATYRIDGAIGRCLDAVTDNWLLTAPDANPAMLDVFRDRDRLPYRNLLPWTGEFAGKYLTSAVQVYRLTGDPDLGAYIAEFVDEMISCQDSDGYLGPWPKEARLAAKAPNSDITWDAWGHYHAMLGLMLWHEETGDERVLDSVKAMADLMCLKFLNAEPGQRVVDTPCSEMNLAPMHSLCLLYEKTGEVRYLDLAKQLSKELEVVGPDGPLGGDYIRTALDGKEYFQTPKPRWESLHPIMGIAELYRITGDDDYRTAFEHMWWSIVKYDRHNNGGFSSDEQAVGNPYHQGAIETCCTIAWMAMSVEMLKLTGDSVVADELELSTLNSIIGLHSPSGRWVTYNTPMDGLRKAATQDIVFQAREGSPELNCCSVNGPRGFGLISDWAVMSSENGIALNYYGPSTMNVTLPSGNNVMLKQEAEYPVEGRIRLRVTPDEAESFALKLRIPYWSAQTVVSINGEAVPHPASGAYLALDRKWMPGDVVDIDLDMSLHFWVGENECEGKTSIYRGPILLTYDRRLTEQDPDDIPTLDAASLTGRLIPSQSRTAPIVLMEFTAPDGRKLRLCDFGTAGHTGAPYRSWLKVDGAPKADFSPSNPLRSARR